jgi:hypothetical protein
MRTLTTNDSNKAFEEACALRGYDPAALLPDVSALPEWLQKYTHSSIKRLIIAEAINEGRKRKPGKEWVYFPVWDLTNDSSGFGFSYSFYDGWFTCTDVGSRLEFFSEEDSDFFGSNFMDLHRDIILNQ